MEDRELKVMGAVVIIGTDNKVNESTINKCNDILDSYRADFPDDALSDFIDRFVAACYDEDWRIIKRCVQYASNCLLDN